MTIFIHFFIEVVEFTGIGNLVSDLLGGEWLSELGASECIYGHAAIKHCKDFLEL
jgi:hypothetical protein